MKKYEIDLPTAYAKKLEKTVVELEANPSTLASALVVLALSLWESGKVDPDRLKMITTWTANPRRWRVECKNTDESLWGSSSPDWSPSLDYRMCDKYEELIRESRLPGAEVSYRGSPFIPAQGYEFTGDPEHYTFRKKLCKWVYRENGVLKLTERYYRDTPLTFSNDIEIVGPSSWDCKHSL